MKIALVAVGKVRTDYLREGCDDYLRRIRKLAPIEIREVKSTKAKNAEDARKSESKKILDAIESIGWKVAVFDERGDEIKSEKFARLLNYVESSGAGGLTFVIGGAWGLSEDVLSRADYRLSMGPMTMSHELARLVLLEQIYRAQTVLRGIPYPK